MALPSHPLSPFSRDVGRTVFGRDIEGYHNIRPGYPDDLFAIIGDRVPARHLFGEIGPGTGLATTGLLGLKPEHFVAFEPDSALAEFLIAQFPELELIDQDFCVAQVEGGFDLIASASSFHWLDAGQALRKAHDLLRDNGILAIWWNVYREEGIGDRFAEAVTPYLIDLELPPSQTASHHYGLDTKFHFARLRNAGFTDVGYHLFRRERTLTPVDARALYASFSLVRILSPDRREFLLNTIESIVREQFGGAAPSVLLTPLYLARKPSL
ncbi:MAG TPA: class I SAM-dependent methyltransferase [Sphingomicrobium sp.]|nr:class I SAM-dependent methyltransferase [Sphingomicrobium sp.]